MSLNNHSPYFKDGLERGGAWMKNERGKNKETYVNGATPKKKKRLERKKQRIPRSCWEKDNTTSGCVRVNSVISTVSWTKNGESADPITRDLRSHDESASDFNKDEKKKEW